MMWWKSETCSSEVVGKERGEKNKRKGERKKCACFVGGAGEEEVSEWENGRRGGKEKMLK